MAAKKEPQHNACPSGRLESRVLFFLNTLSPDKTSVPGSAFLRSFHCFADGDGVMVFSAKGRIFSPLVFGGLGKRGAEHRAFRGP